MTTPTIINVQTPGCWETFSASASQTASWLGHQISELGTALKAGAVKIAAYASDLFSTLSTSAAHYFGMAKGYIAANKQEVGKIGLAVVITGAIALLFARFTGFCNKPATTSAVTSQAVTSQAVTSQAVTTQAVTTQAATSQAVTTQAV